jgi:methyl-accepting chemotaxis protein
MAERQWRLPRGAQLTPESWRARHQILQGLLWLHVPALLLLGLVGPQPAWEGALLATVIAVFAAVGRTATSTGARAGFTSLGLIGTSFAAIELSGGDVSAHLHLFAVLVFVALYQQWKPLLWTVAVVVVHHGVLGLVEPERVFGHMHGIGPAAVMVAVHAGCVVLEVAGILFLWHFAEQAEHEMEAMQAEADRNRQERLAAEREAQGREAESVRERAERSQSRSERLAADAATIASGAREAIAAVAAVDAELANLSAAVQNIAERSTHAATVAATGERVAGEATERMSGLEQSVTEIAEVNALIAQLAGQTNLLSLNATIEAARAGEQGKGFAVVASEVKQLSTETSNSVGKVNTVIGAIVEQTGAAAAGFASTATTVSEISQVQVDIAASVEEQAAVLAEVTRQLSTASRAAQEILDGLDRLTAHAGDDR